MKKYKDLVIAFFILGLPFFADTYLMLFFNESEIDAITVSIFHRFFRFVSGFPVCTALYLSYVHSYTMIFRKFILTIWTIFNYIPSVLNIASVKITGTLISDDFMFTIFNTDLSEAIYFLQNWIGFVILNIAVLIFVFSMKVRIYKNIKYGCYSGILYIIAFCAANLSPFYAVKSAFDEYYDDIKDAEKYNNGYVPLTNISSFYDKNSNNNVQKQTYVFVIGESVDRNHMQIYGYERATTPYFASLKDKNELCIFKNVKTACPFTSGAIRSIFHIDMPDQRYYTLIHFFKDAGFKTYWISNQVPTHVFDNSTAHLGKFCDEYMFINHGKLNMKSPYDEELLGHFELALNDNSADKKFIVLHFMGSHLPLHFRYPSQFNKFTLPKKYNNKKKAASVCLYDNSILYTDYVLHKIITALKKRSSQKKEICWMLYISDHGQDIYDREDCDIGARKDASTYEIPFVVWLSDEYRRFNRDSINAWNMNTKYVTDKAAYSIIDLARLRHPAVNTAVTAAGFSIFSADQPLINRKTQAKVKIKSIATTAKPISVKQNNNP